MKKSKVITILKSLTKEEFKNFGRFVKSNFFNTDKNIISFYEYLKKWYPDFTSNRLAKEKVFHSLFPCVPYSDGKMRNLMSKMYGILEHYLIELEMKMNSDKREELLINALKARNVEDVYKKKVINIIESLDADSVKSANYYLSSSNLFQNLYFHSNIVSTFIPQELLQKSIINHELYYQITKLKLEAEMANATVSHPSNVSKLETIASISDNILIDLFSKIIKLHETESEAQYLEIKNSLSENISLLSLFDKKFVLKHLLEFSIRKIRINAGRFYQETFELYKIGHEHLLLATNNVLSYTTFLNIVTTAARVKKFIWVEDFIKNNVHMLPVENRHEVCSLGFAYVYFYRRKYWEAIKSVSNISFKNTLYQLISKSISLQSFFEISVKDISYFDLTFSYTMSFEKYIIRNPTIGKSKIDSYLSFIRLTRSIMDLIYKNDKNEKTKLELIEYLNTKDEIVERKWLSEKILEYL